MSGRLFPCMVWLCLLGVCCGLGCGGINVSPSTVTLTEEAPSVSVVVSSAGEEVLTWTAASDDATVSFEPPNATGNETVVRVSTDDFSVGRVAHVTFRNFSDPADSAVLAVTIQPPPPPAAPGMVFLPANDFDMGDPWAEGDADELPVHEVTLSAYEIGAYEVTNREFAEVLNWALDMG